ncbi:DUF732 domain-containing protein [Mycobacterium shigaense]|uniref:Uncharacterized protein n=1 Tax=Mycobacterium shigaense TaxID=722731 RepID=A0A1Z4EGL9_9MYCO|nr:DUF732 domain-containing protein [Mycobacterium shigaense]PRI16741.1 hypothetical protein B2J96_03565 [Mycobacterium shigaense]BAX92050.1 hypothetical protein MSG_01897 [Mycobacterium shigaense]
MKTLMCAAIIALMSLGVYTASVANADTDSDFLNGLAAMGITYPDTPATINRGHLVCKALTTGGFTYAETVYGMARNSGSTVSAENAFAAVSVGFYCPAQEGLIAPAQSQFPPDSRLTVTPPGG